MNDKTARAHFGLGKLAMARMKTADALKSLHTAPSNWIPRNRIYRFYLADALSLNKKLKEAERQLQEYLKLNPADTDRVPMAKAALDISAAFKGVEMGAAGSSGINRRRFASSRCRCCPSCSPKSPSTARVRFDSLSIPARHKRI